jgi:hypothetical protein
MTSQTTSQNTSQRRQAPRRRLWVLLLLCHGGTPVTSWTANTNGGTVTAAVVKRVKRVNAHDFDAARYYYQNKGQQKPLLIANALEECEACCDILMTVAGQEGQLQVDLQCQRHRTSDGRAVTEIFENVDLREALEDILWESTAHEASYLSFCEGLLGEHDALQPIATLATRARERLFPHDTEWFAHYFPAHWQPSDAVVLAGAGATSTLHRDPFEWTGTSLCLEGSKVWRFLDPNSNVRHVDAALQSYRLESIAWEEGQDTSTSTSTSISAGWQSDLSLYRTRQHEKIPTARAWSAMEEDDGKGHTHKQEELLRIGSSTTLLAPDDEIASDIPMVTAIQQAGDLLLIPAHWWHQTYALEPSVAIASQRCGRHDAALVLQHILDHQQIVSTDAKAILAASESSPERAVEALLSLVR